MFGERLELSWYLSKEEDTRLNTSPYKARFCLKFGAEIIEQVEFTKEELLTEIRRLHYIGERSVEYQEALRKIYSIEQAGLTATGQP